MFNGRVYTMVKHIRGKSNTGGATRVMPSSGVRQNTSDANSVMPTIVGQLITNAN